MIVLSLIIGLLVIKFKPNHNLKMVFESNARYYPHINDETVLKEISKPKIAVPVQGESSGGGISGSDGEATVVKTSSAGTAAPGKKPEKVQQKIENDEFIPD